MKKVIFYCFCLINLSHSTTVFGNSHRNVKVVRVDEYITSVTFPANYTIGQYIEFVGVAPGAGAAGFYEVSMAYTRAGIAAGATHLLAVSHNNAAIWREAGRINNNGYITGQGQNFTIDCNTDPNNPRISIRAINTIGTTSIPITVYLCVNSISLNNAYTPLNVSGSDVTINKLIPMTSDWKILVGNLTSSNGALVGLKVLENGNVGIGTSTPTDKLSVNGNIRAKEIKVETSGWPDYVFDTDYRITSLKKLEEYIKINKHLPEMPSAKIAEQEGINLGEMNKLLLKKIEELTLHLIEKNKAIENQELRIQKIEAVLGLNK
ncbi:MAG: hypothetical protein V4663_15450 [Bacteroidota bacterium]